MLPTLLSGRSICLSRRGCQNGVTPAANDKNEVGSPEQNPSMRPVLATGALSAVMVFFSGLVSNNEEQSALAAVMADCFSTQNLAHAALLVAFATSAWRANNALGAHMASLAPQLIFVAATASGAVSLAWHRAKPSLCLFALAVGAAIAASAAPGLHRRPLCTGVSKPADSKWSSCSNCLRLNISILLWAYVAGHAVLAFTRVTAALSTPHPGPSNDSDAWALPVVETYTLAFHIAFVAGAGLACADALDDGDGEGAGVAGAGFIGGAATTGGALLIDAITSALHRAEPIATIISSLLALYGAMWLASALRASRDLGELQTLRSKPWSGQTGMMNHNLRSAQSHIVTLWNLARGRIPHARVALCFCMLHGLTFQLQAILLIYLSSDISASSFPSGLYFTPAVNFAIHGAGIYVYNSVLQFSDATAFPRFKRLSIFACFAGGFSSAFLASRLWQVSAAAGVLFFSRAVAGVGLGAALLALPDDAHTRMASVYDSSGLKSQIIQEDKVGSALAEQSEHSLQHEPLLCATDLVPAQTTHFAPWWASFVLAAVAMTWLSAAAGRDSSGLLPWRPRARGGHELLADAVLRIAGAPPAFLLAYHFIFLLSGFAANGLRTGFLPSLEVGVAFVASAVAMALCQIPALLAALLAPPSPDGSRFTWYAQSTLLVALVCTIMAGVRLLRLLWVAKHALDNNELEVSTPVTGKPTARLIGRTDNLGDFWH